MLFFYGKEKSPFYKYCLGFSVKLCALPTLNHYHKQFWLTFWLLLLRIQLSSRRNKSPQLEPAEFYIIVFDSFFCLPFFFFLTFLGPHPRPMEVPMPGMGIRATAAGLHHSHSNTGLELHLQPISQLMATSDP